MQKASDLISLYRNMTPSYVLRPGEDDEQYIQLYEDLIARIRFDLNVNELPNFTLYVTGQSGTGKTSALYFLPDAEIKKNFEIVHIEGIELFDLNDVDIVDILFRVAFELINQRPELENVYKQQLEKIRKKIEGRLTEEWERSKGRKGEYGGSIGLNPDSQSIFPTSVSSILKLIGIRTEFSAQLKNDSEIRRKTREVFDVNKEDLKELVREIIEKYEAIVAPRRLLLVLHDLERILNPDLINNLFIKNRQYLEAIHCKKIISAPVVLSTHDLFNVESPLFSVKLKAYPFSEPTDKDKAVIAINVEKFKKIVRSRIAEGADLIAVDALERAIEYSGGIVRQFLYIVQNAAKRVAIAGGSKITLEDVEEGATAYRRDILVRHSISSKEDIQILDQIRREHKPTVEQQNHAIFIELLQSNKILACQNDKAWYDLNPLVEDTVKVYAQAKP